MNENPIIIALDVPSAEDARAIVRSLGDSVRFYKVGMELYAATGPAFVSELISGGNQVFLDLKFYDIDETIRRAVAQVAKLGVRFLTIHAVPPVMRAAVEGRADSGLQLLAVTVLTSFNDQDLADMGHKGTVAEMVEFRARQAVSAGVDGLVCSPLEVGRLREICGPSPVLVTPGVRSEGAASGDQKRIATPRAAMDSGANYLVIGRQVTRASDPRAEVNRILRELTLLP